MPNNIFCFVCQAPASTYFIEFSDVFAKREIIIKIK